VNTRTVLIGLGVAAVIGGAWFYQHKKKMAAAAAENERLRLALLVNPQRVADVLRAETQRRNSAGSLWAALNQKA
jgi:hypothetical protein